MQKVFGIGIPTLNRADILLPFLAMYRLDFPNTKIIVLDNGNQESLQILKLKYANVTLTQMDTNVGVGASWNMLCDAFFKTGFENVLMLNDDIYLGKSEAQILDLISKRKPFYRSTQDWCSFLLPKKTYETVGIFDAEFYPAYYEDSDYEYRMRLLSIPKYQVPELNPFLYQNNKTLEKAPELRKLAEANKQRYIKKWGGEPKKELFIKPFNN